MSSLSTPRLVLLCVDAHCLIFWDLPGDVLAAPASALWLDRCHTSLSRQKVVLVNYVAYVGDRFFGLLCLLLMKAAGQVQTRAIDMLTW